MSDPRVDQVLLNHPNAYNGAQNAATFLDLPYLRLVRDILDYGDSHQDRTGVGTLSLFGQSCRYDLRERFPLLTCRKVPWRWTVEELRWFLSGSTNAKDLEDRGVMWWKSWGDPETRELGPTYGRMWREYPNKHETFVDQWENLLKGLGDDPDSRRHIVTLWHPAHSPYCSLPPCHGIALQFKISTDDRGIKRLHSLMLQRSADVILGVPINIASYSLLTCAIAEYLGINPGVFTHFMGDAHIYKNHVDVARELLERPLRESPFLRLGAFPLAALYGNGNVPDITNYNPHPAIKAEVAV